MISFVFLKASGRFVLSGRRFSSAESRSSRLKAIGDSAFALGAKLANSKTYSNSNFGVQKAKNPGPMDRARGGDRSGAAVHSGSGGTDNNCHLGKVTGRCALSSDEPVTCPVHKVTKGNCANASMLAAEVVYLQDQVAKHKATVAALEETLREHRIAAILGELGTVYRQRVVEMVLFNTYEIYEWADLVPRRGDRRKENVRNKINEELPSLHVYLAAEVSKFSQEFRVGMMHRPTRDKADVRDLIEEVREVVRPQDRFAPHALELAEVVEAHLDTLPGPKEYSEMVKKRAEMARERAQRQLRVAAEVESAATEDLDSKVDVV